uniref:Uncharacterized protein n=1 Tax=Scleropages formosus TaxID=113540 RepID=A0A8C9VJA1_SCLFO
MSTANTPAPSPCTSAVTFDSKSEAVVLPGGMVSVAGVTVMTGGAELTWGSCLLAFGVWGTLTGMIIFKIHNFISLFSIHLFLSMIFLFQSSCLQFYFI